MCQQKPNLGFGGPHCEGVPNICLGVCVDDAGNSYCTDRCKNKEDCPSGYECEEVKRGTEAERRREERGTCLGVCSMIDGESHCTEGCGETETEEQDRACLLRLPGIRATNRPGLLPRGQIGAPPSFGCDSGRWIGNKIWGYCSKECSNNLGCPSEYRCNRERLCEKRPDKKGSVEFGGICWGRASVCLSGICISLLEPENEPPPLEYYPLDWCADPCDEKRGCPSGYECKEFEGLTTKVCSPKRPAKIRNTLKYFVTTREKELREAKEDGL